jgi:hypothetical protein
MNPTTILDLAPFSTIPCEEGIIKSLEGLSSYILYTIESKTVRKDLSSNLGVPNPDALTFMELKGRGEIQVWINSKPIAALSLDGDATISDIELERGYNNVLIKWIAKKEKDTLITNWRNIGRKVETGFKFW